MRWGILAFGGLMSVAVWAGAAQGAEPYRILGRVLVGPKPLPGVTLHFSDGLPDGDTDGNGQYEAVVPAGVHRYTVTPEAAGYTFQPAQARVWISGGDAVADFQAAIAPAPHRLGGRALDVYTWLPAARGVAVENNIASASVSFNPGHIFYRVYLKGGTSYAFETSVAANFPKCTDTCMALCQKWDPTKGPSAIKVLNDDSSDRSDYSYSTIVYKPGPSGYYYVWIRGFGGATGNVNFKDDYAYTYKDIKVSKLVAGCTNDSSATLSPAHAYFRVGLMAGVAYTIQTSATKKVPVCDDTVLSLYDWSDALSGPYAQLATNDDDGTGGRYSKITYTPSRTGYYYIAVRGQAGIGGNFNLLVSQ